MWYIVLLVVIVLLLVVVMTQRRSAQKQTEDSNVLLKDYEKRVDELEKLLSDYRALEKNFDSVGQGYEQALLAFDKMEEEKQKVTATNLKLEQRCHDLQEVIGLSQRSYEYLQQYVLEAEAKADAIGGAPALLATVRKMQDLAEVGSQTAINTGEPSTARQIADQAIAESGISALSYLQFSVLFTDEASETTIRTAPRKASRALALLLDNAGKFTTEGKVTLYANTEDGKLRFIVEDSGVGVPADEAEHIFEPFVQLNNYFGGNGVGLTAARSIARRLDGDVVLDTTYEGPGARFVLTLPL